MEPAMTCNMLLMVIPVSLKVRMCVFAFQMQGAQFLTELAPLCRISSSDGEEYTVYR